MAAPSFICGTSTVSDFDGNAYNTVLIGTQCWTTTNLKVTKYNNGTLIGDSTNSTWGTAMIGARTENKETTGSSISGYVETFGYLYNWYAVNDSRKLCPDGWHVPTDSEWNKLVISIDSGADTTSTSSVQSTTAGTVMKSEETNTSVGIGLGWNPGSPGTNTSGFSALPGGFRQIDGSFIAIRGSAFFWSATEYPLTDAWSRNLYRSNGNVVRYNDTKSFGASVRCLRD